jgi:hypothetical protein
MSPISIKTKLVSLFVLAFLCLNAGGAVCLVYCTAPLKAAAAETEHCPLPKTGAVHCPHANKSQTPKGDVTVAESNAASCCSLAINVLVAPIERKQASHELTAVALEQPVVSTAVFCYSSVSFVQPIELRPLIRDRRFERIRNRVFRI